MSIRAFLCMALFAASPLSAVAQSSNAARYLMNEELATACEGRGGPARIDGGLVERDFDGDGRIDLLIAHDGIACGSTGRSGFCGAQVCTVKVWLRRGDLLRLESEFLGGGVNVDDGTPPTISGYGHGGGTWSMRWDGTGFR